MQADLNSQKETQPAPDDRIVPFSSPPPSDVVCSYSVVKHAIAENVLDPDAVKVVRRLTSHGYDAYLVGGCVRDILLGYQPKDFDVATSARPTEVKRLFRNCRLIGRRFRLAHMLFRDGKIIEVATFRRTPTEKDDISDRHASENLFGGPADDSVRRDFTINALMYDVGKKEIHDYVCGLQDIERQMLRTIGDADRRFPEDPVRIIRAVKFAVKLDLAMDPDMLDAMRTHAPLIQQCAPARLVEEMFKILRSGSSEDCFDLLNDIGLLPYLLPNLAKQIEEKRKQCRPMIEQIDSAHKRGIRLSESLILATLLHPFCSELLNENGDISNELDVKISGLLEPMRFTKRHMADAKQILMAQRRMAKGPMSRRVRRMLEKEWIEDGVMLLSFLSKSDAEKHIAGQWQDMLNRRKPIHAPRSFRRRPKSGPNRNN